jgi:hypothetical protein
MANNRKKMISQHFKNVEVKMKEVKTKYINTEKNEFMYPIKKATPSGLEAWLKQ